MIAPLPRSGLDTQLCGDAHLSNFGLYGSPERALAFQWMSRCESPGV